MPSVVDILVQLRTNTGNALIDLQLALRNLEQDAGAGDRALKNFKGGLVSLAPAAIPVAASIAAALGPVVGALGAATVATGAFGAAVIPQAKALGEASKAQTKYTDAVSEHGPASKEAAKAEGAYLKQVDSMPPATRRAAVALSSLTSAYTDWSDSLASSTMPVAIKGFAVMEAILPRLTPMVKGASEQFDRLVTALGGGLESPGMDQLSRKFSDFANSSLKSAVDGVLHFSRVVSQGKYDHGPLNTFLDYARDNGPLVKDTLANLVEALANLGEAAANAGPGMLTIVNALARLLASVPPEVLTRLLQLYTALKLLKGTAAGVLVVSGAVGRLATSLGGMAAASAAAGGGLAGVRAALATLSTGTKIAGVIAVIAGVVLVLKQLGDSGKARSPDVDKLTTALGGLGRTGKISGEASRVFGKDFSELNYAIGRLNGQASGMDKFNDAMNKVFTLGMGKSNSAKKASKDIDAVDKSLASLVQNGHSDLASAALKRLSDQYAKGGKPASNLTDKLNDYQSALADAAFEQDLAADSMGLFGRQALETQRTLDGQKQSADGLRQSIQALNDVNRAGIDGMIGFEQAIADGNKALKENGKALSMVNGQLVLTSQKARDEASALDALAAKTDAATAAARDQGRSWQDVSRIYDRGRGELIKLATQMGLSKDQAKALADQILKTPDKTARLKGDVEDLRAKIAAAKKQIASMPSKKTAALKGNAAHLNNVIRDAQARINSMTGKEIVIRATTYYDSKGNPGTSYHEGGGYAHGGVIGAASGGPRSRMTLVGEQGPELVDLAAGSTVHTAGATRQMLAGGGGGRGGVYQVNLNLDGRTVARVLIDPFREEIRDLGGDVQYALGRRF